MKKILILNGINVNMFGHRNPELYGTITYAEINETVKYTAKMLDVEVEIFQTNFEGEIVEKIHEAYFEKVDGVIINPAGWTNHHKGVRDALEILKVPWIEVHMGNIFKKHNGTPVGMTTALATGVVLGLGAKSYTIALQALVEMLNEKDK